MSFPFLDFESSFFTNEELLFLAGASGGGVEYTIINNPATFTTDLAKPLRRLVVPFTPVQSGSGDPSPSNVRPITGWTGLNIYHSGEDTSDPLTIPVSWQTEAGEVYGGELDALTGILTVEWAKYVFIGDEGFALLHNEQGGEEFNYFRWYFTSFTDRITNWNGMNTAIMSNYPVTNQLNWWYAGGIGKNSVAWTVKNNAGLCIRDDQYSTADELKAALVGQEMVYLLSTPQTVQLDPVTLSTLIGENVVWTDTNGDNTIVYLKKT